MPRTTVCGISVLIGPFVPEHETQIGAAFVLEQLAGFGGILLRGLCRGRFRGDGRGGGGGFGGTAGEEQQGECEEQKTLRGEDILFAFLLLSYRKKEKGRYKAGKVDYNPMTVDIFCWNRYNMSSVKTA